jgi:hypothetical protein
MSTDSTILVARLGRLAKSVLPIDALRSYVRTTRNRQMLDGALDALSRDPWTALDAGSEIPRRLIEGWGNASWSIDDEYLIASIDELGRTEGPVLECGSGLSTIVLAIIAGQMGREVWTLEHDSHWSGLVGRALAERRIGNVHLCLKPLKNYGDFSWYEPPLTDMPRDFGLVICDGPPGQGHGGRSGFLPVMRDRLAARCTILLDDTIRDAEKDIAQRWSVELNAPAEICGRRKSFAVIRAGGAKGVSSAGDGARPPVVTLGVAAASLTDDAITSIESLRAQSFADWSLLVSGTASSGSAHQRCTQLAQLDPRIHCHPRRTSATRADLYNGLARKSRSAYFKWLRPGEQWDDSALAACAAALDADHGAVLGLPAALIADNPIRAATPASGFALSSSDPLERFQALLSDVRYADALYGLIRTDALRATKLLQDVRGAELPLLAELALNGRFIAVPGGIRAPRERPAQLTVAAGDVVTHLKHAVWRSQLGLGSKLASLRLLSAHAPHVRQSAARLDAGSA